MEGAMGQADDIALVERPDGLASQVAEVLRGAIVDGQLAPGTHLSVPELARRVGVSRTPAREALLILEREGLVDRRGTTGMQVLVGDPETLADLLELREVLEGLAARRAASRVNAADREALTALHQHHVAVLRDDDREAHVGLDAEFHATIRRIANSTALDEQLARIDRIAKVLNRALSTRAGFDGAMVDLDHGAIIAAITSGDADAAETAMRSHIRRAARFLRSTQGN